MKIYKVGGYVRDMALGLEPKDCDYVVVDSNEDEMLSLNYEKVGADFPVFLHPETGDEYALARVERKNGSGYNGFSVDVQGVTLEEDLFRRDLTINAMAMDDDGNIIDPFNGLTDLKNQVLRHVSKHFAEDPVRILRIARFSARYNFKIAQETVDMMKEMVRNGEFDTLTQERVWKEFEKVFTEPYVNNFFDVLKEIGALGKLPGFSNDFDTSYLKKIHDYSFAETDKYFMSNVLFVFSNIDSTALINWKLPSNYVQRINVFKSLKDNTLLYNELNLEDRLQYIMSNRAIQSLEQASLILENVLLHQNREIFFEYEHNALVMDVLSLKAIDYPTILEVTPKNKIKEVIKETQLSTLNQGKKTLKP